MVTIELVGGPVDGHTMVIAAELDQIYVPERPPDPWPLDQDPGSPPRLIEPIVHIYRREADVMLEHYGVSVADLRPIRYIYDGIQK